MNTDIIYFLFEYGLLALFSFEGFVIIDNVLISVAYFDNYF